MLAILSNNSESPKFTPHQYFILYSSLNTDISMWHFVFHVIIELTKVHVYMYVIREETIIYITFVYWFGNI